jgi:hypothetical protein
MAMFEGIFGRMTVASMAHFLSPLNSPHRAFIPLGGWPIDLTFILSLERVEVGVSKLIIAPGKAV